MNSTKRKCLRILQGINSKTENGLEGEESARPRLRTKSYVGSIKSNFSYKERMVTLWQSCLMVIVKIKIF